MSSAPRNLNAAAEPAPQSGWKNLLGLWFGVSQRVGRGAYAASGFGLMLLKYVVEAW